MRDSGVTIDFIDAKLITLLLQDARTKTKDLAKACGISSTAVGNRIKKLEKTGVITGSAIVLKMSEMGFMYPASLSVETAEKTETEKAVSLIQHFSGIYFSGISFGKCDLQVFFVAKSLKDIESLKQSIRKYVSGRVSIDLWNTPCLCFDNISINGWSFDSLG